MSGRWPANVILSPDMAVALDEQSGVRPPGRPQNRFTEGDKFGGNPYGTGLTQRTGWGTSPGYTDEGGASRFFLNAGYEQWELDWILANGLRPCGD